MEKMTERIDFFHSLFWICIAGFFLFLAGSAVLFFRLKIREAIACLTGRRKRENPKRKRKDRWMFLLLLTAGLWMQSELQVQAVQEPGSVSCNFIMEEEPMMYLEELPVYGETGVSLSISVEETGTWRPKEVQFYIVNETLDREVVCLRGDDAQVEWYAVKMLSLFENCIPKERYISEFFFAGEENIEGCYHAEIRYKGQKFRSSPFVIDRKGPELDLVYEVEASGFWDVINYQELGFLFADEKLTVTIKAKDKAAGIEKTAWSLQKEEEEAVTGTSETFVIPLLEEDAFQGRLKVIAVDFAGNTTEMQKNVVIEGEETHKNTGKLVLQTLTEPSRVVDGQTFYNQDVELELLIEDRFSGIRQYACHCGASGDASMDYREMAGTDPEEQATQERVFEVRKKLTLKAEENNRNNVSVTAEYTDNAGYRESVEKRFCVDTAVPKIEVNYDCSNPMDGRFYNQVRTATVTVWERNFREEDVIFQIENSEGNMPQISSWVHGEEQGDETKHTCTVRFVEDGDYSFALKFQDMAGNKAQYSRVDSFTIDRTEPVLTVLYDNKESRNGFYFNRARTATLLVEERNFDKKRILATVTVQTGTTESQNLSISGWRTEGERHIAQFVFSEDARYTLTVSGSDRAGNLLNPYEEDPFVVDKTKPTLQIQQVKNFSANRGAVQPEILYSDQNCQRESLEIRLTGSRNGLQKRPQTIQITDNGAKILLEDFPYLEAMDDMYTLEVSAADLAGNYSREMICFSVNRFGSVYTFGEKTAEWLEQVYTREPGELVVTETNVDTLKVRKIICSCNGNWKILEEGKDYAMEKSGTDTGWKQYTYRIYQQNFEEEGSYTVTLYSEDRAENVSDNLSKGKKIEFAVDRTAPVILLSGIENLGRYTETVKEGTLDVQDNLFLQEVRLYLNGKEHIYDMEELQNHGGRIPVRIQGKNQWQTLQVIAVDATGNTALLEKIEFLVTPNLWVQFFQNKPLFYGTTGSIFLITAATNLFLLLKKKEKKEKLVDRIS